MATETMAVSSGVRVARQVGDDGAIRVVVEDLGMGWVATTTFVLGLLMFILGVNGLILLGFGLAGTDGTALGGAILLSVTGVLLVALKRVVGIRRAKLAGDVDDSRVVAVVDLGSGMLRDGDGNALVAWEEVTLRTRMQMASSAPALKATWPTGELHLVSGNVFAGGIADVESALRSLKVGG